MRKIIFLFCLFIGFAASSQVIRPLVPEIDPVWMSDKSYYTLLSDTIYMVQKNDTNGYVVTRTYLNDTLGAYFLSSDTIYYAHKSDTATYIATQYDILSKLNISDSVTGYATQYDITFKVDKSDSTTLYCTLYQAGLKALKTTTMTAAGYILGGGDLSSNRTFSADTSHLVTNTFTGNMYFGSPKLSYEGSYPADMMLARDASTRMNIMSWGSSTQQPTLMMYTSRGTAASPTSTNANRVIGNLAFAGYTGSLVSIGAYIQCKMGSVNMSNTNLGMFFDIYTTPLNTATPRKMMSWNMDGTLETYYGHKLPYVNDTSATYNATTDNYIIYVNATTGNKTVNLPAIASSDKVTFIIKRIDNTANVVTIEPNLSETIDGQPNATIGYLTTLKIHGVAASGWYIIGN